MLKRNQVSTSTAGRTRRIGDFDHAHCAVPLAVSQLNPSTILNRAELFHFKNGHIKKCSNSILSRTARVGQGS